MCVGESGGLVTIDDVPKFLRFNRYILSGYRTATKRGSLTVLDMIESIFFMFHNESVNIWSHLIMSAMYVALFYYEWCVDTSNNGRFTILVCSLGFALVGLFSVIYHAGMGGCSHHQDYRTCLNFDVCSIMLAISISGACVIMRGYRCISWEYSFLTCAIYIGIIMAMIVRVLQPAATIRDRFLLVGGAATMRFLVTTVFLLPNLINHDRYAAFCWHMTSYAFMFVGGAINVIRWPEKYLTDRSHFWWIDFIGNSHNIWHILVFGVTAAVIVGCSYDSQYWDETVCSGEAMVLM